MACSGVLSVRAICTMQDTAPAWPPRRGGFDVGRNEGPSLPGSRRKTGSLAPSFLPDLRVRSRWGCVHNAATRPKCSLTFQGRMPFLQIIFPGCRFALPCALCLSGFAQDKHHSKCRMNRKKKIGQGQEMVLLVPVHHLPIGRCSICHAQLDGDILSGGGEYLLQSRGYALALQHVGEGVLGLHHPVGTGEGVA